MKIPVALLALAGVAGANPCVPNDLDLQSGDICHYQSQGLKHNCCAEGLKCYQRSVTLTFSKCFAPGASTLTTAFWENSIEIENPPLPISSPTPAPILSAGTCTPNSDNLQVLDECRGGKCCSEGLKCYRRSATRTFAKCFADGAGNLNTAFWANAMVYDIPAPTPSPTPLPALAVAGTCVPNFDNLQVLDECRGGKCCSKGLKCYRRSATQTFAKCFADGAGTLNTAFWANAMVYDITAPTPSPTPLPALASAGTCVPNFDNLQSNARCSFITDGLKGGNCCSEGLTCYKRNKDPTDNYASCKTLSQITGAPYWMNATAYDIPSSNQVSPPTSNQALKNVVIYLSDDQNWWDHGMNDARTTSTPRLDAFANEGVSFKNAYTTMAMCTPSRTALLTGLYPLKSGSYANHYPMKPNTQTMFSMFAGPYDIYHVGKKHIMPDEKVFDDNVEYIAFQSTPEGDRFVDISRIQTIMTEQKEMQRPFVLFVASDYPHGPYERGIEVCNGQDCGIAPAPAGPSASNYQQLIRETNEEGYSQMVKKDDDQFGSIVDAVDALYHKSDTIVIYASDHGANGKWSPYETALKVAMAIRCEGAVPAMHGVQSNAMVSLIDIVPTIVQMTGLAAVSPAVAQQMHNLDGQNLAPLFSQGAGNSATDVHSYIYGVSSRQNIKKPFVFPSRSVRDERYKLIVNFNSQDQYNATANSASVQASSAYEYFVTKGADRFQDVPHIQLFDLQTDEWEVNNVASDHPEEVERLRSELLSWMASQNDFLTGGRMPLLECTKFYLNQDLSTYRLDVVPALATDHARSLDGFSDYLPVAQYYTASKNDFSYYSGYVSDSTSYTAPTPPPAPSP